MAHVEQYITAESKGFSWYDSILLKIIFTVLLAAMLVIAGSGYFAYSYIKEDKHAELQTLADVTAERLSQHLDAPMWAVDYEKVGRLLSAEMNEARIIGLVVRDEDKQQIFAARERVSNGDVGVSNGNIIGNFITANADVRHGDETIGAVEVYLSPKAMAAEISEFAKGLAILAGLLAVVLTAAIAITLLVFVVRPIRKLTHCAQNISNGDLKQRIELNRTDEIGYLGSTLNRMQNSLRLAIQRIRKADEQRKVNLSKAS